MPPRRAQDSPHHVALNWLQHLLSAMQAAEADTVARSFAQAAPLDVVLLDGTHWTDWPALEAAIYDWLRPIRPACIRFRLLELIDAHATASGDTALAYRVWLALPDEPEPLTLACQATLVREADRWVASHLHCHPVPTP